MSQIGAIQTVREKVDNKGQNFDKQIQIISQAYKFIRIIFVLQIKPQTLKNFNKIKFSLLIFNNDKSISHFFAIICCFYYWPFVKAIIRL
jgi:hypothetical protein